MGGRSFARQTATATAVAAAPRRHVIAAASRLVPPAAPCVVLGWQVALRVLVGAHESYVASNGLLIGCGAAR